MGLSVLLLIGLLHLATSQTCSDFEVFDGDTKENVTCTLFRTPNCSSGPGYGSFPAYLSEGSSVSKPRNFQATPFRANVSNSNSVYEASGVKYEWKVPIDQISRQHIKGFYLRMQPVGSGGVTCRLFDLTAFDMSESTSLRFVYTLFPLSSAETYMVDLLSLPPPTDEEYEEGLYERYVVSVLALRDADQVVDSVDWTTWIIVQPHAAESTVEVKFGFPEKGSLADNANFTEYTIQLVNDQNQVSDKTTYIRLFNSGSVAVYNFTGVSSGRYKVQVQPKDTLNTNPAKCQCWKRGSLGIRDCQPCKTTETKKFNFTSTWRSTSTASTTSTSSTTSTTVNEKSTSAATTGMPVSSGPDASVIVLAVIIPVVLVALLIAFFCCWKQRKAGKNTGLRLDRNENNVNGFSNVFRKFDTLVPGMGKELKVPQVTRKTVLLLASEDHKYFSQALNNFSTFLRLHCQCDVIFAPEQLADVRKTANSYCWLSGKIDQADVVIIVTSQAACRQYQAFQNGQVYKEADLGPEGDLFTPGIKHICGKIASGEDVSKVMMVRFDHTASNHRLPISALPPSFYLLPNRLKSCLLHIHGLDENNMNLSTVSLPLQGNVQELQGGKEWLNAVSEAMAFEREHPAWFEEKFGRLVDTSDKDKPDYDTQVSGLSEESGFFEGRNSGILQRRLSSVSTHAHEAPGEFRPDGLENPSFVFSKSDFIAPSEFEAQSAYTIPYSAYTERERPPEVDQRSTVSDQLRKMNERYEQDRMQELFQPQGPQNIPEEERSAISDQTGYPLVHENLGYPQQNAYYIEIQRPGNQEDLDCISVSSAQSV